MESVERVSVRGAIDDVAEGGFDGSKEGEALASGEFFCWEGSDGVSDEDQDREEAEVDLDSGRDGESGAESRGEGSDVIFFLVPRD